MADTHAVTQDEDDAAAGAAQANKMWGGGRSEFDMVTMKDYIFDRPSPVTSEAHEARRDKIRKACTKPNPKTKNVAIKSVDGLQHTEFDVDADIYVGTNKTNPDDIIWVTPVCTNPAKPKTWVIKQTALSWAIAPFVGKAISELDEETRKNATPHTMILGRKMGWLCHYIDKALMEWNGAGRSRAPKRPDAVSAVPQTITATAAAASALTNGPSAKPAIAPAPAKRQRKKPAVAESSNTSSETNEELYQRASGMVALSDMQLLDVPELNFKDMMQALLPYEQHTFPMTLPHFVETQLRKNISDTEARLMDDVDRLSRALPTAMYTEQEWKDKNSQITLKPHEAVQSSIYVALNIAGAAYKHAATFVTMYKDDLRKLEEANNAHAGEFEALSNEIAGVRELLANATNEKKALEEQIADLKAKIGGEAGEHHKQENGVRKTPAAAVSSSSSSSARTSEPPKKKAAAEKRPGKPPTVEETVNTALEPERIDTWFN